MKTYESLSISYKMFSLAGDCLANIFLKQRLGYGATSKVISASFSEDIKEEEYAVKFIDDPEILNRELAHYQALMQNGISCMMLNGYVVAADGEKCGIVMPIGIPIREYFGPNLYENLTLVGMEFIKLLENLADMHRIAKIVHRDIRLENLLCFAGGIKLIDWGYAVNLEEGGFFQGPYAGSLRTASESILSQLKNGDLQSIKSTPRDDYESLIKTFILLVHPKEVIPKQATEIADQASKIQHFWNHNGKFQFFKANLKSDFSNFEWLKSYFSTL